MGSRAGWLGGQEGDQRQLGLAVAATRAGEQLCWLTPVQMSGGGCHTRGSQLGPASCAVCRAAPQHPAGLVLPTWSGVSAWEAAGGELLSGAGGEPVRLRIRNSSCSREQRSASSRDSRPSRT